MGTTTIREKRSQYRTGLNSQSAKTSGDLWPRSRVGISGKKITITKRKLWGWGKILVKQAQFLLKNCQVVRYHLG